MRCGLRHRFLVRIGTETFLVTAPRQEEVAVIRHRLHANPPIGYRIRIATPETIRAFIAAHRHPALTHYALNRLAGVLPRLSARPRRHARRPALLLAAALALPSLRRSRL